MDLTRGGKHVTAKQALKFYTAGVHVITEQRRHACIPGNKRAVACFEKERNN